MRFKTLGILFVLLLAMIALPTVLADEPSYVIDKVFVDDIEVDGDQTSVELGDSVEVRVVVKSGVNLSVEKEAKVKVWLYGNDYDEVEAVSETFTVYPVEGYTKQKTLHLDLPTNMETGTYTLHVLIYDQEESVREEFTLYVERERHLLDSDSFDYNVEPSSYLEAGEYFNVKVRLENVGAKNEDVKVTVEIPELGISQKTWLNLHSEQSETSDELLLRVPKSAETGDYEMTVTAFYSEGHKFVERNAMLHVKGVEPVVQQDVVDDDTDDVVPHIDEPAGELPLEEAVVVTMDSTSQTTNKANQAVFKLTLASFDGVSRTITFKASGAQLFADVRVDPSFLQLDGGQKAEAYVFVDFHEGVEAGAHTMTLQVNVDDKQLKEVQLTAIAREDTKSDFSGLLDDSNLKIAFVVLVVVLIIIGLLIAFKRVRHDEFPLEPHEDRTYY